MIRAPQKGPENWCRAKIVEKCRKHFWHFLTIFDVFCPARKLSKSVENIFDTFWRFLTFFDVAPFRWPLLRSADMNPLNRVPENPVSSKPCFLKTPVFATPKFFEWASTRKKTLDITARNQSDTGWTGGFGVGMRPYPPSLLLCSTPLTLQNPHEPPRCAHSVRGRKKHINFFNINFLAPSQNAPFWTPRKKFMCLISWVRTPKRDPHKLFWEGFWVQKGVPNGVFSATKSLVYCFFSCPYHCLWQPMRVPAGSGWHLRMSTELWLVYRCLRNLLALMDRPNELQTADCKRGRKKRGRAKIVEKCRKCFWHFLTIFDAFCPARKLSKSVEKLFDTFWHFLTIFDVAPFRRPLLQSADFRLRNGDLDGFRRILQILMDSDGSLVLGWVCVCRCLPNFC